MQELQASLAAAAARSAAASTRSTTTATVTNSGTKTDAFNFMEYMNAVNKSLGNGGMTTQQAAQLITQAAKDGLIKKEDQLNYMMIYG